MKRNLLCGFWYSVVCSFPEFEKLMSLYIVTSNTSLLVGDIVLVSFMYPGLSFLYSIRNNSALYVSVKIPKISSMNLTRYSGGCILGSISCICCSVTDSSYSNLAR